MDYQQVLKFLYSRLPMFQRSGALAYKKDLTNTHRLLKGLNEPQNNFKAIHIAGTNGKGTTAHALASILQVSGYKTGLYTSPHLKSFTERIRIDGKEVSEGFVTDFVNEHQSLIEEVNPSFFELTVAMAFDYFARERVEIAVIETGLGGRLDSTNVLHPILCLITMIGYDHADLLGDSLQEIAGEKAGIIKSGVPVVIGAQQQNLMEVFTNRAKEVDAPIVWNNGITVLSMYKSSKHQTFQVQVPELIGETLSTDINAAYFLDNIPGIYLAVRELRKIGFDISLNHFSSGLAQIKSTTGLRGRWQVIHENPLLIADISHNEPGLTRLFDQIQSVSKNQLHVILGMVREKNLDKIASILPVQAKYYFTQSQIPRSRLAEELKREMQEHGFTGESYPNVNLAIAAVLLLAEKEDLILVCGSTFVVAEIEGL